MKSNMIAELNLIETDGIRRDEITSKYDLLRRDAIESRSNTTAMPSKFSLAGTHLDSVLGRIVTINLASK